MSEQLDEILADVAGAAAGRARAPGAGAARERGKQRRTRQQLTATALSLAVLGTAGAVAAATIHGSNALSATASPKATGSPRRAQSFGGSTASPPDPTRYVAGAWLSESALPYAGTVTWQVNSQVLGTDLHGAVQLVEPASSSFDSSVGEFGTYCSIPALADNALADQLESFDGPITGATLPSIAGIPARADQSAVFYRNQSSATAAWDGIGSGFAACAKFATGSVSGESATYPSVGTATRIVNEPDAQCWTNVAAVSGLGPAVTDLLDDVCLVRRGTVIGFLDVGFEGPAALSSVDFRPVDATIISDLQQALGAYGGG